MFESRRIHQILFRAFFRIIGLSNTSIGYVCQHKSCEIFALWFKAFITSHDYSMLSQWKSCIHMFKTHYDLNQLICIKCFSCLKQNLSQMYYDKEKYVYWIPFQCRINRNNRGLNNKLFDLTECLIFKDLGFFISW